MSNVTTVIFSKNRAMQLDALLRSIKHFSPELSERMVVLWTAATQEFRRGYETAQNRHAAIWIEQTDFERHVRDILDFAETPYTAFFVDDDLMFRAPEWNGEIPDWADAYSLRLGLNTTWCYMLKRPQTTTQHDFVYPFSLDGTIYRTEALLPAMSRTTFDNPNQLEARVTVRADLALLDYGKHSSVVGIPHNAVSDSANPQHMGGSAAALNLLYLTGYRIDYHAMDFRNVIGCHQEIEFKYMKTPNAKPVFSILHPTARLPEGWKPAFDQAMRNCDHPETVEYILCVDEQDIPKLDLRTDDRHEAHFGGVPITLVMNGGRPCSVAAYNAAATQANGVIWINAQDDVFFPPHWDTELLKTLAASGRTDLDHCEAVIHVSSGSPRDRELMAPQIYTRARYERFGHVFHHEYLGMYADDEFTERAYQDGVVIEAGHLMFEQRHPAFGKGQMDAVYQHENSAESYRTGKEVIERRRLELGFSKASIPGTAAPNQRKRIALCCPGQTFSQQWVVNFVDILASLQDVALDFVFGYCSAAYVTRNMLAQQVCDSPVKPDYLLWIDDDNIITAGQIQQLIQDLDTHPQIDMVAGWCFAIPDMNWSQNRTSVGVLNEKEQCGFWTWEQVLYGDQNLLKQVQFSGFPSVLMRYSMLEKLGRNPFTPILSDDYDQGAAGEDVSFCIRAKRAGLTIAVDPRVRVQHLRLHDAVPMIPAQSLEEAVTAPTGLKGKP